MNNKSPRWIHEIPKPIIINTKKEKTKEEIEEAEEFAKAVQEGRIEEWFNKKKK